MKFLRSILLLTLCTLTWNANSETNIDHYALYTSLQPGIYTQGPAWIGNGTQAFCEDLGLSEDNLTHYFVVKAVDITGAISGPSNEVSKLLGVAPPPPPPPPTPRCLKYNPKGKCIKWGT